VTPEVPLMRPALRKAALAVHVITSVGWIGAAAAYFALGIAAGLRREPLTVRAGWIGMENPRLADRRPARGSGVPHRADRGPRQPWGLIRDYWVLIALV
jgi:hypothetical protein